MPLPRVARFPHTYWSPVRPCPMTMILDRQQGVMAISIAIVEYRQVDRAMVAEGRGSLRAVF